MALFTKGGGGAGGREGLHVWRKGKIVTRESGTLTLTQINSGAAPTLFTVSSSGADVSLLDETSFIGLTTKPSANSTYTLTFSSDKKVKYESPVNSYEEFFDFSYDPTTATLTIEKSWSDIYSWLKLSYGALFYDSHFVVADNADAYPDGGTHIDSYWYERINENAVRVDYGEITIPSGTTAPLIIEHSLNEVPAFAAIMGAPLKLRGSTYGAININGYNYRDISGFAVHQPTINKKVDTVEFYLSGSDTTYNFPAGTYKWFVVK